MARVLSAGCLLLALWRGQYITLSAASGSRTIQHFRGPLPELAFKDFQGKVESLIAAAGPGAAPWDW